MTIGTISTSGAKRMMERVGDIQNRIAKAAPNVVMIRIILVLESDMMSSNWATSAERTDIRFPVCRVSKYDASISINDLVASILISCCALYATDCQSWLLKPWKTDKAAKQMKMTTFSFDVVIISYS